MGDNVLDFSNFTGLAGDSFKIKQTWTRVDNERSESPKVKFCTFYVMWKPNNL